MNPLESAALWTILLAAITGLLTGAVRNYAIGRGLLDHPNARSAHRVSTPRGGGAAIVIVVIAAAWVLWLQGELDRSSLLGWTVGGGAVAAVGFIDDRQSLPPLIRLVVHLLSAGLIVWIAGGLPALPVATHEIQLGSVGAILAVVTVVWLINLFNFMDGTDGIAASQAAFVVGAGAALQWLSGTKTSGTFMCVVTAAASLGFLTWNWPPARIFMGDVGSGFLGFALAFCALETSTESSLSLWTWVVLHALFIADATVTLLARLMRRERVFEAHSQHAYQHLSRRLRSHAAVLWIFIAINVCWLLPLAVATVKYPHRAWWLTLVAFVPLGAMAKWVGAGKPP